MPAAILVVDDEPDFERLIRMSFRKAVRDGTYAFHFARDGVEALEQLAAHPDIGLVLTDLNMPRLDGLALLDRVNALDRALRVVVISAYGDLDNLRAAMNRGAYDFLPKPTDQADLTATVRKACEEVARSRAATAAKEALAMAHRLDALKTRFFADLSHEFRTPLTLLLGPLQDALDGTAALCRDDLVVMHRHARRLRRLIDQLLDLAKHDAGRLTLRAARHDAVAFLRDLVQAFVPAAERKRIALHLDVPDAPDDVCPLYFEPDKLEKIVGNLLGNALKFTPQGGTIRVTATATPDVFTVTVRDTGPGIAPEAHAHLFDRFYRGPARGDAAAGSTGIGLALAHALATLHGGTLTAEGSDGQGATFRLRLPRGHAHLQPDDLDETPAPLSADASRPPDEAPPPGASALPDEDVEDAPAADAPTVLVVEDHPDVRAYLRRRLSTRYQVQEAADGHEALAAVRARVPALVVSDVMMPGMDGIALCRTLKAEHPTLPVLLLTARAGEEEVVEGLATGADDYLTKPFHARELLLRAENLIEVRRLLRARFSEEVVLQPADVAVPSADAAFLTQVQQYVEQHMADRAFDATAVAEAVAMSPRQLRRRLRALLGVSTSGFIRSLRLQRAAQLLERRTGNISEVAYAVGYDDARHFARLFRQAFGVPPSAYADGERGPSPRLPSSDERLSR